MNRSYIISLIKKEFKDYNEIISLYLYGSFLNDKFVENISDIDLLFIVEDLEHPFNFIYKIKKRAKGIKNLNLDINIVFKSEFDNRWHIYRPASYFLGVKYKSKLIFGKDLLAKIDNNDFTIEQMYKRLVDLAQSSRAIYINNKDAAFWERKYIKWLRVAALELLFLTGEFDLNFVTGLEKLKRKYKELYFLDNLKEEDLKFDEINKIAEKLKAFFCKYFWVGK